MEADLKSGGNVGKFGLLVQEQDQQRPLPQVSLRGALPREQPSLDEELGGETGLVVRGRAGQGICLWVTSQEILMRRSPHRRNLPDRGNPTVISAPNH
jgi:hypothetical protein